MAKSIADNQRGLEACSGTGHNREMTREFPAPSMGIFLGLQILDVLTTLIGLHFGAQESSSFIGHLIQTGPVSGLIISKIIAAGLAAFAIFLHRQRVLVFLNFWFTAVVGWNLIAIYIMYANN
jgi:hypothetical protein